MLLAARSLAVAVLKPAVALLAWALAEHRDCFVCEGHGAEAAGGYRDSAGVRRCRRCLRALPPGT